MRHALQCMPQRLVHAIRRPPELASLLKLLLPL